MKKIIKILIALATLLFPVITFAVPITVPSAPGPYYFLVSTTTGQYLASSTPYFANGLATSNLCIAGVCNSSWPAGSTFAYPFTTLSTGEQATSSIMAFLGGFLAPASSTLQNFSFNNATGTYLYLAPTVQLNGTTGNQLTITNKDGIGTDNLTVSLNSEQDSTIGASGQLIVKSGGGSFSAITLMNGLLYLGSGGDKLQLSGSVFSPISNKGASLGDSSHLWNNFFATAINAYGSTTLQNFTFQNATGTAATTTSLATTNLCIGGDCRIAWPSGGSSFAWPFLLLSSGEQATSTTLAFLNGFISTASSTLVNFTFVNATGTSATTTNFATTNLCLSGDCKSAWPAGGSSGGLSTTTPWTAGNLAQVVNNSSVTSIATSSLKINFSDMVGTVADNQLASTFLKTIGSGANGALAYWTGTNLLSSVATTSVTCTGTVTCGAFDVLGSSPITINGSAGTSASSTLLGDNNYFSGTDTFTIGNLKIAGMVVATSTTVCANGCAYTSIQTALNAGWSHIYVKNGTYSEQITIQNNYTTIEGESQNAIIQCTGATQSPCVSSNAKSPVVLKTIRVKETNAQPNGIGIDFSNTNVSLIDNVRVQNFATSTYFHDTLNGTFYDTIQNSQFMAAGTCYDFSGTLANDNQVLNSRCQPLSYNLPSFGAYIEDAQVISFTNDDFESTTTAGNSTGIFIDSTSRAIKIENPYIEAVTNGIVSAGAKGVTVSGGQIVTVTNPILPTPLTDPQMSIYNLYNSPNTVTYIPNASSTAFSTNTLCLGTDCRSVWPSGGSSFAWPFTKLSSGEQATSTTLSFLNGFTAASSTMTNFLNFATSTGDSARGGTVTLLPESLFTNLGEPTLVMSANPNGYNNSKPSSSYLQFTFSTSTYANSSQPDEFQIYGQTKNATGYLTLDISSSTSAHATLDLITTDSLNSSKTNYAQLYSEQNPFLDIGSLRTGNEILLSPNASYSYLIGSKFGIQTATPKFDLEVNGTASTTNLFATNSTTTSATSTNLYALNAIIGTTNNGSTNIPNYLQLNGNSGNPFAGNSVTGIKFFNTYGVSPTEIARIEAKSDTGLSSNSYLSFQTSLTNVLSEKMKIGSDGLVSLTNNLLVNGSSTLQNFTFQNATGTSATTTNFATTNLCISGVCKSAWPTASMSFAYPFTTLSTGEQATSTTLSLLNGFTSASSTLTNFLTFATSTGYANLPSKISLLEDTMVDGTPTLTLSSNPNGYNNLIPSSAYLQFSVSTSTNTLGSDDYVSIFGQAKGNTTGSNDTMPYFLLSAATTTGGSTYARLVLNAPYSNSSSVAQSQLTAINLTMLNGISAISLVPSGISYIKGGSGFGIQTTNPQYNLEVNGTASTTKFYATKATTTNATTTSFAITSILSKLLKTQADGSVVGAVDGTDYVSPSTVFYDWLKPEIWSVGTTNQVATANTWYCQRFEVPVKKTVTGLTYTAGSGALGTNGSASIWSSSNGQFTGASLVIGMGSAALTATTSTNYTVSIAITPTVLTPGNYFACMQISDAGTFIRQANGTVNGLQSQPLNEDFAGTYATSSFATYYPVAPALTARTINGQPNMMIQVQ